MHTGHNQPVIKACAEMRDKMAGKNKKIKNKKVIIAVVSAVIILLVAVLVIVNLKKDTNDTDTADISLNKTNLKETNEDNQQSNQQTTVEIQFGDYAVPVGTRLQMTAIVTPMDTQEGLVWSSSDSDVVDITTDGVLTVKKDGTAVITATVGSAADSVIIEGISDVKKGSVNNFPVYTGSQAGSATGSGSGQYSDDDGASDYSGSTGTGTSGSNGSRSTGSGGLQTNGGSSQAGSGQAASNGNSGNAPAYNGNASDAGQNGSGQAGSDQNGSGQSGSGTGLSSGQIGSSLEGMGFEHDISNVYICKDDSTYYGEIITQPNVTIIYIKQRNGAFDAKIQSVISMLLPAAANEVWNNYQSASSDRTFTADGRRVRIVTAAGGGHSQIVIYN